MREHVAPVVVVLDEIALCKAQAIEPAETVEVGYPRGANLRNGEVAGLLLNALDAVLGENSLIQRGGAESVCIVHLEGTFCSVADRRKLRNRRRTASLKGGPEKTGINSVVLEILVNANEILIAVAEVAGIESTRIRNRQRAGDVLNGWRPAKIVTTRVLAEVFKSRLGYAAAGQPRGRISVQDMSTKSAWMIRLRPRLEFGSWGKDRPTSRGSR